MTRRTTNPFTRADYERLPEGFPAELLSGELVKEPAPAPWHQVIVLAVAEALRGVADRSRVLVSPVDFWIDDLNVLQPDVALLPEGSRVGPGLREIPTPLLVVEVLSPATADRDRGVKAGIYLAAGVREVWIVDPDARTVEARTGRDSRTAGLGESLESGAAPGLTLRPDSLFVS